MGGGDRKGRKNNGTVEKKKRFLTLFSIHTFKYRVSTNWILKLLEKASNFLVFEINAVINTQYASMIIVCLKLT